MGKKILAIVSNDYEEMELWYPVVRLREAGYEVDVAGEKKNELYTGKHGLPIISNISFYEVDVNDYIGLVIPGGWAPDKLRRYEKVIDIVKEMDNQNKAIGAICHAAWVLVTAGILKGRRMTSVECISPELKYAGAEWINESCVIDNNLVTSRTPPDLPDYMIGYLEVLGKVK